jgi:thiamine-monophosphate kinase
MAKLGRTVDEIQLVKRVVRALSSRTGTQLRLGIGDDAAILKPRAGVEWVVSCDGFYEKVHFNLDSHPPESVGYKSLARATSDLAAMGAKPRFFLLTLALPAACTGVWLDRLLRGMTRAADAFGLILAGGDTANHSTVAISITVIGEVAPGHAVTRAGARPGDRICVSGTLGRAELGLGLVLRGLAKGWQWQRLLQPHLFPQPRIALARWLARRGLASSMIDLSDGLSTDLAHICEASGVGACVNAGRIPAVSVPPALRHRRFDPLTLALHGGEDYELLFTVPPKREHELRASSKGLRLTCIGEITKVRVVILEDSSGRKRRLEPRGWDHFRNH